MASGSEIVLITGGNTGLGFETVRALYTSTSSCTIILSGRSAEKVREAAQQLRTEYPSSKSTIDELQLDISDDNSINAAFAFVQEKYGKLNTLINNAGASFDPLFLSGKMSLREMMNDTWDVNVTSTHVLTYTFAPLLIAAGSSTESKPSRMVFLTSGLSTLSARDERIAANQSPAAGWPKPAPFSVGVVAYPSSKTGLNMLMLQWQRILKNDGVMVFSVSPGLLATSLGGDKEFLKKIGAADPADGAKVVVDVVEGRRDADVGKIVWTDEKVQPW